MGVNKASLWSKCHGSGNQFLIINEDHEIVYTHLAKQYWCLDQPWGNEVGFYKCHGHKGNQEWYWSREDFTIRRENGLCLTGEAAKPLERQGRVFLSDCNGSDAQKWEFEKLWNRALTLK